METQKAIDFFYFVCDELLKNVGENHKVDIRPYADEWGIDLGGCVELIREVVDNNSYNCGCHFNCTKFNVLPDYDRIGFLKEDRDHIEGLGKILQVHTGQIRDY